MLLNSSLAKVKVNKKWEGGGDKKSRLTIGKVGHIIVYGAGREK